MYAYTKCHGFTWSKDCTNCPLCARTLLPTEERDVLSFDSLSAAIYWVDAFYGPNTDRYAKGTP